MESLVLKLFISVLSVLVGDKIREDLREGDPIKPLAQHYYRSPYYSVADIKYAPPTLTIKSITYEKENNRTTGNTQTIPVLWFKEGGKGLVLSKYHCEQLEQLFGLDPRTYKGRRVQLKVQGINTISIHDPDPRSRR